MQRAIAEDTQVVKKSKVQVDEIRSRALDNFELAEKESR
jgi:hypothetical protein